LRSLARGLRNGGQGLKAVVEKKEANARFIQQKNARKT